MRRILAVMLQVLACETVLCAYLTTTEPAVPPGYSALFVPARVTQVSKTPRLYEVLHFATAAEMEHIIRKADQHIAPQTPGTPSGRVYEMPVDDPMLKEVFDRMGQVFPHASETFSEAVFPSIRVRRYQSQELGGVQGGDYHPPHVDWFPVQGQDKALIISLMIYLNTPEGGGGTEFSHADGKGVMLNGTSNTYAKNTFKQGFRFTAEKGKLAIWWSCTKRGHRDPITRHSGMRVTKGIKWSATRFLYASPKLCSMEPSRAVLVPPGPSDRTDLSKTCHLPTRVRQAVVERQAKERLRKVLVKKDEEDELAKLRRDAEGEI